MASYIDQHLNKNEEVILRAHVSWMSMLPWIIAGVLSIYMGIGILILIYCVIRIKTTELALTNQKVIAKFGIISRQTIELRLEKIEGVSINQTLLGRLFNYGTVVVSGTGGTKTPIPLIKSPMEFRKAVNNYLEDLQK